MKPEELTLALEYSNIVFCVLFGTEMVLKVMAYGIFGYISDGFNVFDGVIVILRWDLDIIKQILTVMGCVNLMVVFFYDLID